MPNKPRQEKQRCSRCGTRTRRWMFDHRDGPCRQAHPVCIDQDACRARMPQDAPNEAQAADCPAQDANVPQAGGEEPQHTLPPDGRERFLRAAAEMPPDIKRAFQKDMEVYNQARRPNEVKIGTAEQEFDIPLTPHEISAKGAQLSGAVQEIEQIEAEKARAKREFCARLKAARQNVARLAQAVATGTVREVREAEVYLDRDAQRVLYRAPVTGALYSSRAVEPGEQLHLPLEGVGDA